MENTNGKLEFIKEAVRVQQEISANKGRKVENKNKETMYTYRNADDILSAFKKLQSKLFLSVADELVSINNAIFVKATAKLTDGVNELSSTAFAELAAEGRMSPAQQTGSTSSFARKYALAALFALDDEKDADAMAADTNGASMQKNDVKKVENNSAKNKYIYVIKGNTYSVKEEVKALGFKWNGEQKCFLKTSNDENLTINIAGLSLEKYDNDANL